MPERRYRRLDPAPEPISHRGFLSPKRTKTVVDGHKNWGLDGLPGRPQLLVTKEDEDRPEWLQEVAVVRA
jgi:hypothetical protein